MVSRSIFTIADDLTGALEAGAKFAHVAPVRVTLSLNPSSSRCIVVDTESRHLTPGEASDRVRIVGEHARRTSPWLIYKKTDSTLRGNIGPELATLATLFPERELVYVPAYPEMGRTVRDGQLLVSGLPVHQTEFAGDPLNPVRNSDIATILNGLKAQVVDGETEADVQRSARSLVESGLPLLVAGPAAIAAALARLLSDSAPKTQSLPPDARCIIVNGSLHPVAAAQFARVQGSTGNWFPFSYQGPESGMARAHAIGARIKQLLEKSSFDAIIVVGGDTACGIHAALGGADFESCGEVLPGIPLSKSSGIYWITKAGGFGSEDILERIKERR